MARPTRVPRTFIVDSRPEDDGLTYVRGLASPYEGDDLAGPDTLLMHINEHGEPTTRLDTPELMLGALYDLFQTRDGLREGDTFDTCHGIYVCRGVHVFPCFPIGDEPVHPDPTARFEVTPSIGHSQNDLSVGGGLEMTAYVAGDQDPGQYRKAIDIAATIALLEESIRALRSGDGTQAVRACGAAWFRISAFNHS